MENKSILNQTKEFIKDTPILSDVGDTLKERIKSQFWFFYLSLWIFAKIEFFLIFLFFKKSNFTYERFIVLLKNHWTQDDYGLIFKYIVFAILLSMSSTFLIYTVKSINLLIKALYNQIETRLKFVILTNETNLSGAEKKINKLRVENQKLFSISLEYFKRINDRANEGYSNYDIFPISADLREFINDYIKEHPDVVTKENRNFIMNLVTEPEPIKRYEN